MTTYYIFCDVIQKFVFAEFSFLYGYSKITKRLRPPLAAPEKLSSKRIGDPFRLTLPWQSTVLLMWF
jgi:hypothetical protein